MVVGILQIEITIDGATSLKDKRRVVRSIKDRIHREFNVSIAEVDKLDQHHVASLGVTLATNDVSHCQSVLNNVLVAITHKRDCYVNDHNTQILTGQ